MGCSGLSSRSRIDQNKFIQEKRSFQNKQVRGVNLDADKTVTKTMELKGEGNMRFLEEIINHADESGVVKPWLENIISPDYEMQEDLDYPKYNLEIEHVFGYRMEDCRQNLFFLSDEELLYMTGSMGVIQNIDDYSQMLFGGFINKGDKECHDSDIMALSYYKGCVSMVATGQRGLKPIIFVWSPYDTSVVYGKFTLPKGTKEVSALEFDKDGRYIIAAGKDDQNSIFVFDLQNKDLVFSQETNQTAEQSWEYIMDVTSNEEKDEFCICGVNKIFFGYVGVQKLSVNRFDPKNMRQETNELMVFTSCYYVNGVDCIVGNEIGEFYIFNDILDRSKFQKMKITGGAIMNISYDSNGQRIFVTDSNCKVIILGTDYKQIDSFSATSVVKALDVNEKDEIAMGMSDGSIVIKYYREKDQREETIIKSHSQGTITGLDFIPECRIVTTGQDNRILIWNIRSKKCEAEGQIEEYPETTYDRVTGRAVYLPKCTSSCCAYNKQKGHIAVGLDNGMVTIRKSIKDLDRLVPDIVITEEKYATVENSDRVLKGYYSVTALKYTNICDWLLACSSFGDMKLLDVNEDYEVIKDIRPEELIQNPPNEPIDDEYVLEFDWDTNNNYIQTVTNKNRIIFYNIFENDSRIIEEKKRTILQNLEFPSLNCKFGFSVQGVYEGSTDPNYISTVAKAHTKKLLAAGDDDKFLKLYNYPCICENPKKKDFKGHGGSIKRIVWSTNDDKIITVASDDKAIILWNVVEG